MSDGIFDLGEQIVLQVAVPGFRSAREAASLDWSRKVAVPAGVYVVERAGRSEAGLLGDGRDGGRYYEIAGPVRAWVRENYLLAGRHRDWPWDMIRWAGPVDWNELFVDFLRMRVEGRTPPSRVKTTSAGTGASVASPNEARQTDEYGVRIAPSGGWLPDFDDAFDLADELVAGAG